MSEKKVLTKKIAEEIIADEDTDALSKFSKIDDDAAESLFKCKGYLDLNGLTELSDAAAESLSKCKEGLSLDGLGWLSDAGAESLSKRKEGLSLNGLMMLSDAAAESLSKCKKWVSLDGLTELSDAAAENLSKCKEWVYLNGLTELSDAAAESLSKCKGNVDLNGLTELSDAAAESLSKCKGELYLNGLTELSDAAAESLSKCKGELYLWSLTQLSDEESFDEDQSDDEFTKSNPLVEALAKGDIETANSFLDQGYRINSDPEVFSGLLCNTFSNAPSAELNSLQVDPDRLRRIVPLAEVIRTCGPLMHLDSSFSIGPRPRGWGNLAYNKRILSWRDDGFGLVGDQLNDVDVRIVTEKSLENFEDAIIAGPLNDNYFDHSLVPTFPVIWEKAELDVEDLNVESFRRLFTARQLALKSLEWTYDFELNAYTKEAFQYCLFHDSANENIEILYAKACLLASFGNSESQDELEDCLNKIQEIQSEDSSSIQAFRSIFQCLLIGDPHEVPGELSKLEKLSSMNDSIRGIHQIFSAWPWAEVSPSTAVSLYESCRPFMRQLDNPYFSWLLEDLCHRLLKTVTHVVNTGEMEDNDCCETLALLVRTGLMDYAVPLFIKALSSNNLRLLEAMIEKKAHAGGHIQEDIYFVPLASAVMNSNPAAIRLLCENGADPLDKSHYGGWDSFECLHSLIESEESKLSLQIPEGRQFGNEQLEQLRKFILDTKFDINNDYHEIGNLLFSCHTSHKNQKAEDARPVNEPTDSKNKSKEQKKEKSSEKKS